LPRGYHDQINRIRQVQEKKKYDNDKMAKEMRGEKYDALALAKMKPPSFVDGAAKSAYSDTVSASARSNTGKKLLLLYVDVNVTPTKTGRIGIYEGDDLFTVAKNFSKTF
jgi:hypothetical protein